MRDCGADTPFMATMKRELLEPNVKGETLAAGDLKPSPKPKKQKVEDFGLALELENCRAARSALRECGRLVQWMKQENVITLEVLGLNISVMSAVASYHCSRHSVVKAPAIDFLKSQAWAWVKEQSKPVLTYVCVHFIGSYGALHLALLAFHVLSGLEVEESSWLQVGSREDSPRCLGFEKDLLIQFEANRLRQQAWPRVHSNSEGNLDGLRHMFSFLNIFVKQY